MSLLNHNGLLAATPSGLRVVTSNVPLWPAGHPLYARGGQRVTSMMGWFGHPLRFKFFF